MARGGARSGSGPKKGTKYRKRFQLTAAADASAAKPTQSQRDALIRRQIILCVADGMTPEKIAAVLGYQIEKLQAVYAHELEHGRAIVRAEELMRLDAASAEGKVAASKILMQTSSTEPPPPGRKPKDGPITDDIAGRALRLLQGGKKE